MSIEVICGFWSVIFALNMSKPSYPALNLPITLLATTLVKSSESSLIRSNSHFILCVVILFSMSSKFSPPFSLLNFRQASVI